MNRTIPPATHLLDRLDLSPKEERVVLPNGSVLYVRNSSGFDVLRLDIVVGAGLWRQELLGQNDITNHMIRLGAAGMTSTEIAEKLDFCGARLVMESSDKYNIISLYCLRRNAGEMIDLLYHILTQPTFEEKEFDLLKAKAINGLKVRLSQTTELAKRKFFEAVYGQGHPVARFCNVEDYEQIGVADIKAFYEKYYNSRNCTFFAAGDIDDEVRGKIADTFGASDWGNGTKASDLPRFEPNPLTEKYFVVEKENSEQNTIFVGGPSLPSTHEDFYKYKVMVDYFGGFFGSLLSKNIREDKGYTYGIRAMHLPIPLNPSIVIVCEADSRYTEGVIREIYNEVHRIQNEKISESELEMLKRYLASCICRSVESPYALSAESVDAFCEGRPKDSVERSFEALVQITPDEIIRLAREHLGSELWKEVVAGKNPKNS